MNLCSSMWTCFNCLRRKPDIYLKFIGIFSRTILRHMEIKIIEQASDVWKTATRAFSGNHLNPFHELNLLRRALHLFQAGEYHYMIFNLRDAAFEFVSESVVNTLGYPAEQVTIEFLVSMIHPDDKPYFLAFEKKVVDFFAQLEAEEYLHYKVRHDYRIKNSEGKYLRMMNQLIFLELNEEEREIKTLLVQTDISEIKKTGRPVLSILGLNDRPSHMNIPVELEDSAPLELGIKEKEVLLHLVAGHSNTTIAEKMHISELTVQTHRKNILEKTGAFNTQQAIKKWVREGLI